MVRECRPNGRGGFILVHWKNICLLIWNSDPKWTLPFTSLNRAVIPPGSCLRCSWAQWVRYFCSSKSNPQCHPIGFPRTLAPSIRSSGLKKGHSRSGIDQCLLDISRYTPKQKSKHGNRRCHLTRCQRVWQLADSTPKATGGSPPSHSHVFIPPAVDAILLHALSKAAAKDLASDRPIRVQ